KPGFVLCRSLEKVRTASSFASRNCSFYSIFSLQARLFRCGKTSAIGAYDKNEAATIPVRGEIGGYLGQIENRFAGGSRAYSGGPGSLFAAEPNQRLGPLR